jgi:hypothetical protein
MSVTPGVTETTPARGSVYVDVSGIRPISKIRAKTCHFDKFL